MSQEDPLLADIPPYVFALIAAFFFALGGQIQNIGLQTLDSRTGTMLSICTNALLYWAVAPWFLNLENFLHPAVLIFALIGIIRPALSANMAVAGMKYLGPTLTTTLTATSPLFAAAFGILILDEMPNAQIAIGTAGIIGAIVFLSKRKKGVPASWPLWALALPVGAAAIRGFTHGIVKIGMDFIPDPYFVGLVGASVSTVVTAANYLRKRDRPKIALDHAGTRWFLFGGIFFGTAVLSLNVALFYGSLITVVPIVAISPIFTMLMSVFVFRRENITPRIVIAVMIVMPSVVAIALAR